MSAGTASSAGDGRRLLPSSDSPYRGWAPPPAGDPVVSSSGLWAVCLEPHELSWLRMMEQVSCGGVDDKLADGALLSRPIAASVCNGKACSPCSRFIGVGDGGAATAPGSPGNVQRAAIDSSLDSPGLLPHPPPSAASYRGLVFQGMEGVHQVPDCSPGVCGNVTVENSSMKGIFERPMASKVQGNGPNSTWKCPQVFDLPILEDSSSFSIDDNSIRLDDVALEGNLKRFEAALVGCIFGKRIPFALLSSELKRRWDCFSPFRLITVSVDSFVCFFASCAARDGVLAEGPWLLAGQVIRLDRWMPSFSPSSLVGYSTPVWVRLPSLPLCCWDKVNIACITSPLGQPLWIDAATNQLERGVFARVCVKVDLSKPLKPGVWVHNSLGSFYQPVEYEGLPLFCFHCGLVGHKGANCKSPKASRGLTGGDDISVDTDCQPGKGPMVEDPIQADGNFGTPSRGRSSGPRRPQSSSHLKPVTATLNMAEQLGEHGLGPWMIVQWRRPTRSAKSNGSMHGSFPISYRPTKQVSCSQGGAHVAANLPNSRSSLGLRNFSNGAASSQMARTRPLQQVRSSEWVPKQSHGAPATSQADSSPPQASLSPSPPSLRPPLKEGDVLPCLAAGSEVHRSDAQALLGGSSRMAVDQAKLSLLVQDHASSSAQQDKEEQLVFGGFKALPVCREGQHANPGTAKKVGKQRRGARLGGNAAAILLTLPSSCSLPMSSLCMDVDFSPGQGLNDTSSSEGAIVPYNYHEAIARMALEGGKRKGVLSLKVDRMLNDLGPVVLTPRKQRMIALNHDGGDASPSPQA